MSRPKNDSTSNEGVREIVLKSGALRYEARLHRRGFESRHRSA